MWFWLFWISISLVMLLLFYVRWLLKTVAAINDDIRSVNQMVEDFEGHIQAIYNLEMFYGDDTLKTLMGHARELSSNLKELDLILNKEEDEYGYDPSKEE